MVVAVSIVVLVAALGLALGLRLLWRRRRTHVARGPFPVVLVHGLLGFDEIELAGRRLRYFRGIAEALEQRHAAVHVVRLPPLASVHERATVLAAYIRDIPAARINIVAHSMGGVDARYAISQLAMSDRVASLITIGTPHRGTPLAGLGNTRPARVARAVMEKLGVRASATDWLTPEQMAAFNRHVKDEPRVYYGSVVARPDAHQTSLPLRANHMLMKRRCGTSDGVVPCTSQAWGEVIAEVEADHWAQIGWSARYDARPIYRDILDHLRARGL